VQGPFSPRNDPAPNGSAAPDVRDGAAAGAEPAGAEPKKYRARAILESIPESAAQREQRAVTDFIEDWSDVGSMILVCSQLFVLITASYYPGFNYPVPVWMVVCGKLFGDLVAIISFGLRCAAPFNEHGVWHFDWRERTRRYVCSGAAIVDFLGFFPIDLIAIGSGYTCAQFRPDRCDAVNGLFGLNRLLQCRGMLSNFGDVAENQFLRRGLHPILGRIAEVLVFLLCLTHCVACGFNFLLSRGDKVGTLYEYFGHGFDNTQAAFQYFLVMDWALKSLIGLSPRGSTFPPARGDLVFIIITTVVGVGVFTIFIATIKLYLDRDCPEKEHGELLDETIDMVQYMELNDGFRAECVEYFDHMFRARFHVRGMRDFEGDLAGSLARKLRFVVGRDLVRRVPLLRSLCDNEPFVGSLMKLIEPLVLPPRTVLFRRDDAGSTMLIIIKGTVNVLSPADDATVVATLGNGKVVGEVALLMDAPRTATVVTCDDFVNAMSLDRRQMAELMILFPEIAPMLMTEMARRMRELNLTSKAKPPPAPQSTAPAVAAAAPHR
jgi:hypothetical protein